MAFETVAIGMTIAMAAASAATAYTSNQAKAGAAKFQAEQYRRQKDYERVAALEQEQERRRQLEATESAQSAIAASRGTSIYDAPTFLTMGREDRRIADQDIDAIRIMGTRRQRQLDDSENQANYAARSYKQQAWMSAGMSLVEGAYKSYKLTGGSTGGSDSGGWWDSVRKAA